MLSLLVTTAGLVALLYVIGLPAAFLLGAMGAAMIFAGQGEVTPRLPGWLFPFAQAVVGCLIARNFTLTLFRTVGQHLVLFAGTTLSVLFVATALGLILTRLRVLPGSTALWGSFPGAATVMVLISESFGGDMPLVALMQYLRVVIVALTASLVGRLWGLAGATVHHPAWLAPVAWPPFLMLLALILIFGFIGPRLRLPASPLLLPMIITTVLQDLGYMRIELPQPFLAASYLIIGWAIGFRFTRDIFRQAAKALPRVLASIVTLVGTCAAIGWVLARIAHLDGLTAYLATSPGGADSVAIIASSTPVDASIVMAVQIGRFLSVLLLGPVLAKGAARLTGVTSKAKGIQA
jgi:membrane AbrB-like protein